MSKVYWDFKKSKYNFMKNNIDLNSIKDFVDDLWESRALKLVMLYNWMWWYNNIDFDCLSMSEWWLNKFRAELSKYWYIKKLTLSKKAWYIWYVNPKYWNRWKATKELWEAFKVEQELYQI